jgi:two-component system, NtrC family, nitrogen regulation sensor histidine kinase GlnL
MPSAALLANVSPSSTLVQRVLSHQAIRAEIFPPGATHKISFETDIVYAEILNDADSIDAVEQLHERLYLTPIVGLLSGNRTDLAIKAFRAGLSDMVHFSGDVTADSIEAANSVFRALRKRQSLIAADQLLTEDEQHDDNFMPAVADFVHQMPQPAIVLDSTARIVGVNTAAEQAIGYIESEVLGKSIARFLNIAPEEQKKIIAGQSYRSEVTFQSGQQSKTIGYSISPRLAGNGEHDGAVMMFKDITEDKLLRQLAEKAEKMQTLGEIAAAISHEVKNPLAGIKSMVQAVIMDVDPSTETYQYVKRISQEVDRINTFIESTFAFARHKRPRIIRVEITGVIDTVAALLQENFKTNGVELVKKYAPNLPTIRVDPDQLHQVFLNIMLNAVEAMVQQPNAASKKHRLLIGVRQIQFAQMGELKPHIEIVFQDNGTGVPESLLSKIFDPFFTTKSSGTGLGLAICFKIISEHNGRIDIANATEGGAIISIKLPTIYQSRYETSGTGGALNPAAISV